MIAVASAWVSNNGPMIDDTLPMLPIPPCNAPWRVASTIRDNRPLNAGKTNP